MSTDGYFREAAENMSPEQEHPQKVVGWAAQDSSGVLSPFRFSRRANGDDDVTVSVLFCGICHSDLHFARNDHGLSHYPMVPGHEIIGIVTAVGCNVQKLKVGDTVGVGTIIGACHSCDNCERDLEVYCPGVIVTYNSTDRDGTKTYGGFSDKMVVHQRYVVKIPDSLPPDAAAPLLCAGITVYSPLRHFGLDSPGLHVGVVGLGGLGHLAVKFAKAFGCKVTVISSSPGKQEESIQRLGADSFILNYSEQMKAAVGTMDGILDTVSATHPIAPLIGLLKPDGKLIMLGVPEKPVELPLFPLIVGRRLVAGSATGGMRETQEMIDFAGEHGITADVEMIPIDYVNTAMERLARGDIRYRFVIDVGNTLKA